IDRPDSEGVESHDKVGGLAASGVTQEEEMAAIVGDRVAVQTKSVHAPERMGTVEAVLAESPPRYDVRWDNGGWSIISPTDGALRVIPGTKRRPRRRTTAPPKEG